MKYIILLVGLMVLSGCNSEDDFKVTCGGHSCRKPPADNPAPLRDNEYKMVQCEIYFDGSFWGHCPSNFDISPRQNQPIFTALMDCQTAIGYEQQNDPLVWDDSQEDRSRRWAVQLYCAGAL